MPTINPTSPANARLLANVHPPDWQNPTPADRYNLVVIGGGSAGLIAAAGAAGLGAKVALVERDLLGGDCLNVGCVPSKTLIRSARAVAAARNGAAVGVQVGEISVDFPAIMERVRAVRADISPHDSAARYRAMGVDVFLGEAQFSAPDYVRVGDSLLHFKKAVIATGSRPVVPPIDGLAESGYHTNETIFELTTQPQRLAVLGAGPIGCELAQAFQRLGTAVTLIDMADQVLGREDREAAQIIQRLLTEEGIALHLESRVTRVEKEGDETVLHVDQQGATRQIAVDALLVAVGRRPNIEGLGLEQGEVGYTTKGLVLSETLQTTNPNIYASGDVAVPYQFTHMADATSRIVLQNALFPGPNQKWSDLIVPWVTYTDPEVAHVGRYPHQLDDAGIAYDEWRFALDEGDRGRADAIPTSFVKVQTKRGSDKILGATILSPHAGELIASLTLAMTNDVGLKGIASTIFPYPTLSEGIKQIGNQYTRGRFSPLLQRIADSWFNFGR
ncbi:MAG: mercuric reductase [Anaerolineales bacterium]|nr:mercuric reductase [Anaerolineales bacterium]MCB9126776.1 mercuric reductase [Ardenticatenales bacterium]MCB9172635.1 mercuric reductase [Ardenticatenales bacterium]